MLTTLSLAAALLAWPDRTASRRLRALTAGRGAPARRRWTPTNVVAVLAVALPLVATAVVGIAGGLAGAIVSTTFWWRRRDTRRGRDSTAATAGLAAAVRALATDLRAGVHPAVAAEAAAADGDPATRRVMRAVAAASRLGGDVEQALSTARRDLPDLDVPLRHLALGWRLAQQHGLPLADMLEAVWQDLDQRVRFARQTQAKLAGPRASATVLAGLPVLGLALGEAMGAHPATLLFTTGAGHVLLLIGVALACAGVLWTARITRKAVRW